MPTFNYEAITKNGNKVKYRVNDTDKESLYKRLKRNGLTPISIKEVKVIGAGTGRVQMKHRTTTEALGDMSADVSRMVYQASRPKKKKSILLYSGNKIRTRDIIIFTQSFLLLKKAEFNNIHALESIIDATENERLRDILMDILRGVESGEYMYTTMEYYSSVFPVIYVNMIKVGELSGTLTNALEQALNYLETSSSLIRRVKKIVIPNLLQFFGLIGLLVAGTLLAVPAIQDVFEEVGTKEKLPAITIAFSNFLNSFFHWWYVPLLIIIALFIAFKVYTRTPNGKFRYHKFLYQMPLFGNLIYSVDFSRVMRAVSLNIKNGMRIQQALEVSQNVVRNTEMLSILQVAINNCMVGKSWIEPFEESGFGNSMTTEMLNVGMETDLTTMMDKLLEFVDFDINNILAKIMKALPEISYSIVGVVLIFFVLVVLVPCIQVYMGSFLFSAYL